MNKPIKQKILHTNLDLKHFLDNQDDFLACSEETRALLIKIDCTKLWKSLPAITPLEKSLILPSRIQKNGNFIHPESLELDLSIWYRSFNVKEITENNILQNSFNIYYDTDGVARNFSCWCLGHKMQPMGINWRKMQSHYRSMGINGKKNHINTGDPSGFTIYAVREHTVVRYGDYTAPFSYEWAKQKSCIEKTIKYFKTSGNGKKMLVSIIVEYRLQDESVCRAVFFWGTYGYLEKWQCFCKFEFPKKVNHSYLVRAWTQHWYDYHWGIDTIGLSTAGISINVPTSTVITNLKCTSLKVNGKSF